MSSTADVIVIGLGPGGEAVGSDLARAGLDVAGVEAHLVGGECPYYGCIPSKMMIRAANSLAEAGRVPVLAGASTVHPDFVPVARRIREEATTNWDDQIAVDRFEDAGGRVMRGHGVVTGPRTVEVEGQELTARKAIVLNTGTSPAAPPIPGLDATPYWTNREIVAAEAAPESMVVLGGGAIGVELAQAFSRFGTTVDVVELAPRLLPLDEPEAGDLLGAVLGTAGVGVHTGVAASAVSHDGARFTVQVGDDRLSAERLLVATGRQIDLAALGLDSVGVDTDRKSVDTDPQLRVVDGIYAIGDITGEGAFTHMSMYQANVLTRHLLGDSAAAAEYHAVPRVTFTDPEIGAVGLTEAQARARGVRVETALAQVPTSARGWIHGAGNEGLLKLVADADRGVLVGATSAGPHGGEVLSMLTLAVHERTPVERLKGMIYAYPTFHRGIEAALEQLA